MSLIRPTGVLAMVAKAQAIDEESTRLLVEMTLFDLLVDMCDIARPQFEEDTEVFIAKRAEDVRRALVQEAITKRLAGEDIDDLIRIAADTTLEDFGKGLFRRDNKDTAFYDGRDMTGRFASAATAGMNRGKEAAGEYKGSGYVDPIRDERYTALRETGAALGKLKVPGSSTAGAMLTAAGGLGPEAERVLGRGLKRTAYRYRGTERTADRNVTTQVKNARALVDATVASDAGDPKAGEQLATLNRAFSQSPTRGQTFDRERRVPMGQEPFMAVTSFWDRQGKKAGFNEDQTRLAVQGDIGAEYLRHKLPTPKQTAISMAAGRTPPSVGLLIDRDGDVVSEAQGFNGDHFLPFDLKNLKRMHGGQYVRTRAMGGPTVEDVYTGLMTGARQMQVVSNSGVFTVEFDPSIRGGRRYSDKATQMIRRYEALLGTIGSGDLMQQDVSPEVRRQLRSQALTEARGNGNRASEIYGELLEEERTKSTFAQEDDEDLQAKALEQIKAEATTPMGHAQIADLAHDRFNFLRTEQKEKQVKRFQLDADGYAAALRSLHEEFPFYIRAVRTETIPEFVKRRGLGDPESANVPVHSNARDAGHIERGETNISVAQYKQGKPKTEENETYGYKNHLGRGKFVRAGQAADAPVAPDEKSADGTSKTPGSDTARQSQQPNKSGWTVQYDVVKDTEPLDAAADFTKSNVETATEIALNEVRDFMNNIGGRVSNDKMNGDATQTVALASSNPVDFAVWLGNNGGARKLAELKGDDKIKAIRLLQQLPDKLARVQYDVVPLDQDIKAAKDKMQPLMDILTKAAPFSEPFSESKLKTFSTANNAKPMAFPEIVAAGNQIENYNRIEATAKRKPIGMMLGKANLPQMINTLKDEMSSLEANPNKMLAGRNDRTNKPEVIKEELIAAHFAWSFEHAKKIAQSMAPSTPAAPSASAPAGSLPFGPQATSKVGKSYWVEYHPDRLLDQLPAQGEWGQALREVLGAV